MKIAAALAADANAGHVDLLVGREGWRALQRAAGRPLRPIEAYDILMWAAKAVLSGGVRRSATICLFSADDEEMAAAKTHREKATKTQIFIQAGLGALGAAVDRHEIEDEDLEQTIGQYVEDAIGRLKKIILPEDRNPFRERKVRMGEGVHPAEEWDFFYEMQVAEMAGDKTRIERYLFAAGILQARTETIATLFHAKDLQYGLVMTARVEKSIREETERRQEDGSNGEDEPQKAHRAHEERTLPNAELRSGKGWVVGK